MGDSDQIKTKEKKRKGDRKEQEKVTEGTKRKGDGGNKEKR